MFDVNKIVNMRKNYGNKITVGNLIEQLSKLPQDAELFICGDDLIYIHMTKDEKIVNIDTEDLCDEYADDMYTSLGDYYNAFHNGIF